MIPLTAVVKFVDVSAKIIEAYQNGKYAAKDVELTLSLIGAVANNLKAPEGSPQRNNITVTKLRKITKLLQAQHKDNVSAQSA